MNNIHVKTVKRIATLIPCKLLRMQYFIDNFLPWQREAKFAQVSDILIVPSVVPIKRTNKIDLRVCKTINQSAPEGQILSLSPA